MKQVTFTDNDKELVNQIEEFQKAKNLRHFVEAVRVLCKEGLRMSDIVKNLR